MLAVTSCSQISTDTSFFLLAHLSFKDSRTSRYFAAISRRAIREARRMFRSLSTSSAAILAMNSPPVFSQSFDLFGILLPFSLGDLELLRKPLDLGTNALDFLVVSRSHDVVFHHHNVFIESLHHLRRNQDKQIRTSKQTFKEKKVGNEPWSSPPQPWRKPPSRLRKQEMEDDSLQTSCDQRGKLGHLGLQTKNHLPQEQT